MKKYYIDPEMELVLFGFDVLTTSGEDSYDLGEQGNTITDFNSL